MPMTPRCLIPIAEGSESLETVVIVNVLRRAGIDVTLASTTGVLQVSCTRGISLIANAQFEAVVDQIFDMVILPGGERGAQALGGHAGVIACLTAQRMAHRWYGAICAAPALALQPHGLLDGKQATCYPAFREQLLHFVDQPVVVDGHCITSQGPATAMAFALQIIECLTDPATRRTVAADLLSH